MTCPHCGRYAPPDPETGYDVDELCPSCVRERNDCANDEDWDSRRDERHEFDETDLALGNE